MGFTISHYIYFAIRDSEKDILDSAMCNFFERKKERKKDHLFSQQQHT